VRTMPRAMSDRPMKSSKAIMGIPFEAASV
jgi:hypothetical protein